ELVNGEELLAPLREQAADLIEVLPQTTQHRRQPVGERRPGGRRRRALSQLGEHALPFNLSHFRLVPDAPLRGVGERPVPPRDGGAVGCPADTSVTREGR